MKLLILTSFICAAFVFMAMSSVSADESNKDKPYKISEDGKVDWYTFSGYRRYHSECHVCHGPAGLGSSFAPNLLTSVKTLGYGKFFEVIVSGRVNVNTATQNVMPSFATNLNVMCFVNDIYAYLIARADGAVDAERPVHSGKPKEAAERDANCFGDS